MPPVRLPHSKLDPDLKNFDGAGLLTASAAPAGPARNGALNLHRAGSCRVAAAEAGNPHLVGDEVQPLPVRAHQVPLDDRRLRAKQVRARGVQVVLKIRVLLAALLRYLP